MSRLGAASPMNYSELCKLKFCARWTRFDFFHHLSPQIVRHCNANFRCPFCFDLLKKTKNPKNTINPQSVTLSVPLTETGISLSCEYYSHVNNKLWMFPLIWWQSDYCQWCSPLVNSLLLHWQIEEHFPSVCAGLSLITGSRDMHHCCSAPKSNSSQVTASCGWSLWSRLHV